MLAAFAEKAIAGLVFSALIVGSATYFGQAFIFDPLILIFFIAIAITFRRNIDLLTICSLFIADRAVEELMWRFLENTIWFKIPSYLIFGLICFFMSKGLLRIYITSFFLVAVAAELYWFLTDYKAPFILWYCFGLTTSVVLRRCLRMRTFWLIEINPRFSPQPLALDTHLLFANAAFIVSSSLSVFEFYIRHFTGQKVMVVYTLFPYFNHTISVFMLYMIVVQSISHLKTQELSA